MNSREDEIFSRRWCRVCHRITNHRKTYGRVPACQEHPAPPNQPRLFPFAMPLGERAKTK